MVLVTHELATEKLLVSEPQLKLIDASDLTYFSDWLELRRKFVEEQGWRIGEDYDRYDADPMTLHVVSTDTNRVAAGMRLTPQSGLEETLSWSMISDTMREQARTQLPSLDETGVWDLTRLVPGTIQPDKALLLFAELLGAGFELCSQADPNPRWVFATSLPFFTLFKRNGMEFTPIVRGRASETDSYDTVLCYVDTVEREAYLAAHQNRYSQTYEAVQRGMQAAAQLSERAA